MLQLRNHEFWYFLSSQFQPVIHNQDKRKQTLGLNYTKFSTATSKLITSFYAHFKSRKLNSFLPIPQIYCTFILPLKLSACNSLFIKCHHMEKIKRKASISMGCYHLSMASITYSPEKTITNSHTIKHLTFSWQI